VQVNDNVSVAATTTAKVPLVCCAPVQSELPLAVQAVAFWLLHVSVTVSPVATDEELEVSVTNGAEDAMRTAYKP
jgi:hypothetical protein